MQLICTDVFANYLSPVNKLLVQSTSAASIKPSFGFPAFFVMPGSFFEYNHLPSVYACLRAPDQSGFASRYAILDAA